MASKLRRDAVASRARLRTAAEREFAARGFAGATVDRIAAKAGVTKAMLYYHFDSKAALYREILRDTFGAVADRVAEVRAAGGSPEAQVRGFVRAINDTAMAQPHFPPIWLRELADGGRHIDDSIAGQLVRVLGTLAAILADGRKAGDFGPAPVLTTQLGIVGPLLLAAVAEPFYDRNRSRLPPGPAAAFNRAAMLEHVEQATLATLTPTPSAATDSARRTR